MLQDIVEAVPLENYLLKLRFEDGVEGVVDVAQCVSFTGVFAPLRGRTEFAAVQVMSELGTVCWPAGGPRSGRAVCAGDRGKDSLSGKNRGLPVKEAAQTGAASRC